MSKFKCAVCGGAVRQQRVIGLKVIVSVEDVKISKSDMVRVVKETVCSSDYHILPNDIIRQKSLGMRCEVCMTGFALTSDPTTFKGARIE